MFYKMKIKYQLVFSEYPEFDRKIKLGLCCINNQLRVQGIFCSRTVTRNKFTVEKAKQLALQNIEDIYPIIKYNDDHRINVFRLSSDIFPHFTDDETEPYDMSFANDALKEAGELCKIYEQRVTMHPGQYNQIGSINRHVFEKTVADLSCHADILDIMNVDNNGILTVHGGGTYGDKESTKRRWIEQFDDLPKKVKNRLVIENCEKGYSVRDCIDIANETGISVVFDSHHYQCYNHFHPSETQEAPDELIEEVLDTWKNRIPSMHISEQKEGALIGAHSDYIEVIPDYFLSIPDKYNREIHIDVEAKAKEAAIFRLFDKYPEVFPKIIK